MYFHVHVPQWFGFNIDLHVESVLAITILPDLHLRGRGFIWRRRVSFGRGGAFAWYTCIILEHHHTYTNSSHPLTLKQSAYDPVDRFLSAMYTHSMMLSRHWFSSLVQQWWRIEDLSTEVKWELSKRGSGNWRMLSRHMSQPVHMRLKSSPVTEVHLT